VVHGDATLRLAASGLPGSGLFAVLWQLNTGDGYSIGAFKTSSAGTSIQSSLRMYRSPATAGDQVLLSRSDGATVAQLNRC
jgi:hypothetical protein